MRQWRCRRRFSCAAWHSDLVEVSANLTRKHKKEQLQEEVKAAAEEHVLKILCGKNVRGAVMPR